MPPCWWNTPPAAPGTWRNSRAAARASSPGLGLSAAARFTGDARERGQLWQLRKGLYASVAGARPQGTTALLEDIVVPVPVLGRTCRELIRLFDKYSYSNSVIFGHAKDGNVHFMLTDGFATAAELDRYSAFTEDMVDLVLAEGGSLKAEHGTGRVMAPYVRRQYGDELYDVMRSIKRLFDPAAMLNPGVLMDEDPLAHLRHIKTAPPVAEEVDRCVSCGYCEPVCPSKDITLTPRQRIVTLRAIEIGPAGRGHRAGQGTGKGLRVRVRGHLRRGRDVPDRLPGGHQYRVAREAPAEGRRRPARQRGVERRRQALGRRHPGCLAGADGRRQAPGRRHRPAQQGCTGSARSRHRAAVFRRAAGRRFRAETSDAGGRG